MEFKENMLAIDEHDAIVSDFATGTDASFIGGHKQLKNFPSDWPVIFRGMTQRKVVAACQRQSRDYYYIDTGYIGNLGKHKRWHRIVKNGMQHSEPNYNLPSDRFDSMLGEITYNHVKFDGWKPEGSAILVVTPSDKPCNFYGVNRDTWVSETIQTLREHTDREIIVRDKADRRSERVRAGSIYNQFIEDDVYAVVTYNSIAAIEAIGYGIPAFALAPTIAAPLCLDDLSKIESPLYEDVSKVEKWQHWMAYCQYAPYEMIDGTAMQLIKEHDLK